MNQGLRVVLLASALVILAPREALSQAGPTYLTVDGEVQTVLHLTKLAFEGLPRARVEIFDTAGVRHTYEGVNLGGILALAGVPLRQSLKGADLAKYVHVQGLDGFVAVFSLPEFDKQDFLVADMYDGKPLAAQDGPLQIISPDEPRHSRWIKQLVIVRVKRSS